MPWEYQNPKIRVSKPRIGGGFGAKQTVVAEIFPAFVTWKTGKPSMIIYSRQESPDRIFPRHEMEVTVRLGAMKNGKIRANRCIYVIQFRCVWGTWSDNGWPVRTQIPDSVMESLEAHRFSYDVVYSNVMSAGAYRGYGATQGVCGRSAVNQLAAKIGIDPLKVREMNMVREGCRCILL